MLKFGEGVAYFVAMAGTGIRTGNFRSCSEQIHVMVSLVWKRD